MKKSLLSVIAMVVAGFGLANATVEMTTANVQQPAGDTLLFALPVDVNVYQDIQNYYVGPTGNEGRVLKFQPEYLVTAQDFTKGDVNVGTATLPANAKVIGLALDGYDMGSDNTSKGVYLEVTAWCRNVADGTLLDGRQILNGYNTFPPVGPLFTDTVTYRGYELNGKTHPGFICTFDMDATADNPGTLIDIPFGNPDDPDMPFCYKGQGIYLTLWMCNWFDVKMKYRYMAYDQAETEMASLMRSGNFCFNNETYYMLADELGMDLMYELPAHRLPAFRTPYYTNDLRVSFTNKQADLVLTDADGNVVAPAEDGNYYCLDNEQTYVLTVDGEDQLDVAFDDIYKDVEVVITKNTTAVDEISAAKAVASVTYYNLAGQQSAQPVDGVNIVVTTYTDGTRTTAKVIK